MSDDPVSLFLAELQLLDHERTFRVLLEQSAAIRQASPPDVESYAVAGIGLLMALESVPGDVVTKTTISLSRLSEADLESGSFGYVAIVNGTYLSLPDGLYDLATMQKLKPEDNIRTLKAAIYNVGELWQIAKKVLVPSEPPAQDVVAP